MSYRRFCAEVEMSIRRGDLKPIWRRALRSPAFREALIRLELVTPA